MFTNILIPLDGSEFAEAVLPDAQALAKDFGAELTLLHVHTPQAFTYAVENMSALVQANEYQLKACQRYIDEQAIRLRGMGFRVKTVVNQGRPADVILSVAHAVHADLIAMTTHGRSGVSRLLLGSVADAVVHGANMPVLLERGQTRDEKATPLPVESAQRSPVVHAAGVGH